MTTIVIEGRTLFTDSMHIRTKGTDAFRNTKIAFNESRTIAYAYTGGTLPDLMLNRLVRVAEFELVRGMVQRIIGGGAVEETAAAHEVHRMLGNYHKAENLDNWHVAECLVLANEAAFHILTDATVEITTSEYTGIGCYIPSYGIYRKMGLSPLDSFGKIFEFGAVSAGPVNVVHADMLNKPDVMDYVRQINDGNSLPVLRAVVTAPPKKPVRRVTKPKAK